MQKILGHTLKRNFSTNPFQSTVRNLTAGGKDLEYFNLGALNDTRLDSLPYSVRVLLESAVRNCDEFTVKGQDVENILDWEKNS